MDARSGSMRMSLVISGISLVLAACQVPPGASQGAGIGESDLAGIVTGANGPEAGVWVIAETNDLPTKFAKIVVTDDRGRYLIPELPKANYSVWVRGYGLVDSPKVQAAPGRILDLTAVVAPSAAAAAQYYPAIYWYSMLKVPERNEFPIGKAANQGQWLDLTKTDGCYTCHQLGNKATRTIPKELGHFDSSVEAWARRIASGQAMTNMTNNIGRLDAQRMLAQFADWTDRIAAGELPASRPERPQGLERNVVITLWDWSRPSAYLHDEISSDKRNPTVNANGLLYGATRSEEHTSELQSPDQHSFPTRRSSDLMLAQFADWTDRIAAGELPASRPERPQGLERNVVITLWDWSRPSAYLHDEISSDKRNPTVNANGLLYGAT